MLLLRDAGDPAALHDPNPQVQEGTASCVTSLFIAACYLTPLLGGYVADKFLGKYRTIVYFAVPYVIGQLLLAIEPANTTCLFLSLGLLAMGSGVIKPNISTLMGQTYDQQRPGRSKLRSDAFALFYGSINIGSAISMFARPLDPQLLWRRHHAYAIAFLFPAVLMIMAFIVFALGKPFYAVETIRRVRLTPAERRERMGRSAAIVGSVPGGDGLLGPLRPVSIDVDPIRPGPPATEALRLSASRPTSSRRSIRCYHRALAADHHALAPAGRFGWDLKPTSKMLIGFCVTTATMVDHDLGGLLRRRTR